MSRSTGAIRATAASKPSGSGKGRVADIWFMRVRSLHKGQQSTLEQGIPQQRRRT
jgi:hypothetical protein